MQKQIGHLVKKFLIFTFSMLADLIPDPLLSTFPRVLSQHDLMDALKVSNSMKKNRIPSRMSFKFPQNQM